MKNREMCSSSQSPTPWTGSEARGREMDDAAARLKALVAPLRSLGSHLSDEPGQFSPHILVGSASHAWEVDRFAEQNIIAV